MTNADYNLLDLMFTVTFDGTIVNYYAKNEKLLYSTPEVFLGKKVIEVFPSEQATFFSNMITLASREKKVVQFPYNLNINETERSFMTEFVPCISVDKEVGHVLITVKDVTANNNLEKLFHEAKERFKIVFDTARSGIVFRDINNNIIECNKAFSELLDEDKESLSSFNLLKYTHPDDIGTEMEQIESLMRDEVDGYRLKKRYITSKHRVIWVDVVVSVIRDENRVPVFFVEIVNDITESVLIKRQLNQTIKAQNKLFSIIGHDLRNPLNGILGLIDIFKNERVVDDKFKNEIIELMNQSALNAIELLEDLLTWARTQTNNTNVNLELIEINTLVRDSLEIVKNGAEIKDVKLAFYEDTIITGMVDKNMFRTIVRNIVSNAIKFTNTKGTVNSFLGSNTTEFWIEIVDNGIGMNEETLESLFDETKHISKPGTSNERGSGLGLFICKEFIDKHNGKIEVKSTLGKGSSFKVIFPLKMLQ